MNPPKIAYVVVAPILFLALGFALIVAVPLAIAALSVRRLVRGASVVHARLLGSKPQIEGERARAAEDLW